MLAAISKDDTEKDVESMAAKILKAKLFDDTDKDPVGRVSSGEVSCLSMSYKLTHPSGKKA